MDEKKKLIIIGVLVAVILAVGAFQLVGGGGSAPTPVKAKPAEADAKKADENSAPKNALATLELAARDPFKAEQLGTPDKPNVPDPVQKPDASRDAVRRNTGSTLPVFPISPNGSLPGPDGKNGISVKPDFNYALSGVILGSHSAAVFVDAQGGQRLVPVGGSVDGDTRVISIEKGAVTVNFRGKMLRISGGNGK